MSGTDADQRPVPAESDTSDSPLALHKIGDAGEENQNQEDEKSPSPHVHIPDATFVVPDGRLDDQAPTHPYIASQPFFDPNTSSYEAYPPNNNAKIQPMLDPQAQMRVIHNWMGAMREVVSLRDTILTVRMDIKKEKTRGIQQEEYFQNVMDAFMALLNSVVEQQAYLQSKNQLDDLAKKMQHSREDLRILRQRTNNMEDMLSRHEYELNKLEEQLYHQIDLEYRTGSTQPTLASSHASIATQPTMTSSHTSIATRQQTKVNAPVSALNPRDEHYSRLGDLRILLDRLNEFEYELRIELDERDLLRASGQIQISDDVNFFEETRVHRAKLQKEFDEAQADVERLKQVCIRNGIEFEDVQFHSPFYMEDHSDEAASVLSTQAEAARLPLPPSPSGILEEYFATRERVDHWLQDPASDGPHFTGSPTLSSGDWVLTQSWPNGRRPSLSHSAGNGAAQPDTPQWKSGPKPGSKEITALLEESMIESRSQSHKSI